MWLWQSKGCITHSPLHLGPHNHVRLSPPLLTFPAPIILLLRPGEPTFPAPVVPQRRPRNLTSLRGMLSETMRRGCSRCRLSTGTDCTCPGSSSPPRRCCRRRRSRSNRSCRWDTKTASRLRKHSSCRGHRVHGGGITFVGYHQHLRRLTCQRGTR